MKRIKSGMMIAVLLLAGWQPVYAQGHNEGAIEEIVVTGLPIGLTITAMEMMDLQGDLADQIADMLADMEIALAEMSEAHCAAQIESWRQDCHSAMATNNHLCLISGNYILAPVYQLVFNDLIADGLRPFGSSGLGYFCSDWYATALLYCDAIAASERAPTIAMCGSSGQ